MKNSLVHIRDNINRNDRDDNNTDKSSDYSSKKINGNNNNMR